MMTTAIPARLEFLCGHAALVSLPRVKGETTSQRQDRITAEKSGAQTRQCDFCSPDLVIQASVEEPHNVTADVSATQAFDMPIVKRGPGRPRKNPLPTATVASPAASAPRDVTAVPPTGQTDAPVKRGRGRPRKNTVATAAPSATVGQHAETGSAATLSTPGGAPVKRGPGRPRKNPLPVELTATTTAPATRPTSTPRKTATRATRATRTVRRPRAAAPSAAASRFTITFIAEEIVRGTDIADALRQVQARRATEIVAISALD